MVASPVPFGPTSLPFVSSIGTSYPASCLVVKSVEAGVHLAAGEPAVEGPVGIVQGLVPLAAQRDRLRGVSPEPAGSLTLL